MIHTKILLKAPARVCLFGDHQDYLGLPVIAAAINRFMTLKADEIKTKEFRIHFLDMGKTRVIKFTELEIPVQKNDFLMTALQVLKRYGCKPNQGYEIFISGNIPINAGLSSSSSLVVIWIHFLLKAFGVNKNISANWVAKMAYQIEVLEHKGPGGLMDQYTISLGNLLHINTVTGDYKLLNSNLKSLIIAESGVPKKTLAILKHLSTYAQDSILAVKNIHSDFDIEKSELFDYEKYQECIPDNLKKYFFAALKNYDITKKALKLLETNKIDIENVGQLMTEHHNVLKDLLQITVPEIDKLIDVAKQNNALGAKIVGSGGGGCIVALVKPEDEENIISQLKLAGAKDAYKINIVEKSGIFYD